MPSQDEAAIFYRTQSAFAFQIEFVRPFFPGIRDELTIRFVKNGTTIVAWKGTHAFGVLGKKQYTCLRALQHSLPRMHPCCS